MVPRLAQISNLSSILWITGAAGAGKTALAQAVSTRWNGVCPLVHLDGDRWREVLGALGTGYLPEQRLTIGSALARLAVQLGSQGVTVVVSTIAAFAEVGAILDASPVPLLRVRIHARWDTLQARRTALYAEHRETPMLGPWPFAIDLELHSDDGDSADELAAQVYRHWP